jgi:hypothetical protein
MYGHDSRTGPSPFSEGSRGKGLSRLDPRPPLLSTTETTALGRFVTRLTHTHTHTHTHTRHTHLGCSPLSPQATPRSGMGSYACIFLHSTPTSCGAASCVPPWRRQPPRLTPAERRAKKPHSRKAVRFYLLFLLLPTVLSRVFRISPYLICPLTHYNVQLVGQLWFHTIQLYYNTRVTIVIQYQNNNYNCTTPTRGSIKHKSQICAHRHPSRPTSRWMCREACRHTTAYTLTGGPPVLDTCSIPAV